MTKANTSSNRMHIMVLLAYARTGYRECAAEEHAAEWRLCRISIQHKAYKRDLQRARAVTLRAKEGKEAVERLVYLNKSTISVCQASDGTSSDSDSLWYVYLNNLYAVGRFQVYNKYSNTSAISLQASSSISTLPPANLVVRTIGSWKILVRVIPVCVPNVAITAIQPRVDNTIFFDFLWLCMVCWACLITRRLGRFRGSSALAIRMRIYMTNA